MIDPFVPLRERILAATRAALGDEGADGDPALHRSQHADYQADLALALARKLKKSPREVAAAIAALLPADDVIAGVEVSGPGFLNIVLRTDYLGGLVERMRADVTGRLGVAPVAAPETVVIDYSAPNVAKEMHVGHLRSTIIGDAHRASARMAGAHGDPPQPRRRLGHALRHADRAPARRARHRH